MSTHLRCQRHFSTISCGPIDRIGRLKGKKRPSYAQKCDVCGKAAFICAGLRTNLPPAHAFPDFFQISTFFYRMWCTVDYFSPKYAAKSGSCGGCGKEKIDNRAKMNTMVVMGILKNAPDGVGSIANKLLQIPSPCAQGQGFAEGLPYIRK